MAQATAGRVVVTGASTGIGRACVVRFAQLGYTVIAGVRNIDDGETIRAIAPNNIRPVSLDVTSADSIAAAVAAIGDDAIVGLVNNAGVAVTGPLELVPVRAWREQFEVNVLGLVAVTQAFLPALRRSKGRVVNIGSIAGRSALPGSGPYDSSKFAVEGITDALRMEVRRFGMHVSLIEAGAVATSVWEKTLADMDRLRTTSAPDAYAHYERMLAKLRAEAERSARNALPPDAVAKVVVKAMNDRKPKARYLVGRDAWFWLLMNLLPDRWRDGLILSELER